DTSVQIHRFRYIPTVGMLLCTLESSRVKRGSCREGKGNECREECSGESSWFPADHEGGPASRHYESVDSGSPEALRREGLCRHEPRGDHRCRRGDEGRPLPLLQRQEGLV